MKVLSKKDKILKRLKRLPLFYLTDEILNDPVALESILKTFGKKKIKISKNGIVNDK